MCSEADLILQHYGYYVHEYLVQQQLIREWQSFFSLPEEDQEWEIGRLITCSLVFYQHTEIALLDCQTAFYHHLQYNCNSSKLLNLLILQFL